MSVLDRFLCTFIVFICSSPQTCPRVCELNHRCVECQLYRPYDACNSHCQMNKIKYIDKIPYIKSSSICLSHRPFNNSSHVKFLVQWLDGEKIVLVETSKGQSYCFLYVFLISEKHHLVTIFVR